MENIRKNKSLAATPFVFITAKVEREDLRKGMNFGADDYLTKPFNIPELLDVIETRLNKHTALNNSVVNNGVSNKKSEDDFLIINTGKSVEKVQINTIECILADNVFSQLYLIDKRKILIRKSLNEWETILPENIFSRIHRSTLINLNHVKLIERWINQKMMIYMQNLAKPLTMSRNYAIKLRGKLII